MSNIIKAQPDAVQLSEGKLRQYHRESMKMIAQGLALGFHGRLIIAAALWNIRELKLHEIDGLTLKEFADKSGIGQSTMFAYLQVGDRLRAPNNKSPIPIITQKDIKDVFEVSSANKKDFTLRGLFKSAQDQSAFDKYLTTGKLDDVKTEATKLLKPRKLTAEEEDKLANDERVRTESADRAKTWGHSFARQHGIVWDTITKDWKNEDGTPLSDKQRAEMTKYSDAIAPIEKIRELIADVSAEVYKVIHGDGEAYRLFNTRASKNFANEADANRRTITLRIESLQTMLSHFYEGEIADAEKEYRNSIQ